MKLPVIWVIISVFVFYLIVPLFIWLFARSSKVGKILTITMLIMYAVILFFGITSRIVIDNKFAIVSLDYSANWCDKTINFSLLKIDKIDLLINIVMLIPIGLTIVYFNNKSIVSKFVVLVIVGVVVGVSLETIQFILPVVRSVQLSDVLLNTFSVVLGGIIGLLYNFVTCRIKRKK